MSEIRLFLANRSLPLKEPIGGNETPALLRSAAERRFLEDSFGPRVDELLTDLRVLRPRWDEPPAQIDGLALPFFAEARGEHGLSWEMLYRGFKPSSARRGQGIASTDVAISPRQNFLTATLEIVKKL
jgi:hypothetical protein